MTSKGVLFLKLDTDQNVMILVSFHRYSEILINFKFCVTIPLILRFDVMTLKG